jgi:hypothetical protein
MRNFNSYSQCLSEPKKITSHSPQPSGWGTSLVTLGLGLVKCAEPFQWFQNDRAQSKHATESLEMRLGIASRGKPLKWLGFLSDGAPPQPKGWGE